MEKLPRSSKRLPSLQSPTRGSSEASSQKVPRGPPECSKRLRETVNRCASNAILLKHCVCSQHLGSNIMSNGSWLKHGWLCSPPCFCAPLFYGHPMAQTTSPNIPGRIARLEVCKLNGKWNLSIVLAKAHTQVLAQVLAQAQCPSFCSSNVSMNELASMEELAWCIII